MRRCRLRAVAAGFGDVFVSDVDLLLSILRDGRANARLDVRKNAGAKDDGRAERAAQCDLAEGGFVGVSEGGFVGVNERVVVGMIERTLARTIAKALV